MDPKSIYCNPGDIVLSAQPSILTTVLGSCVSVCLYDQDRQIAAMNHFLLPLNEFNHSEIGKYGDTSIKHMIKMVRAQIGDVPLFAKIFGGSSILMSKLEIFNTGVKNCMIAKKVLQINGIEIINADHGGLRGRKVDFDTATGTVAVKYLTNYNL